MRTSEAHVEKTSDGDHQESEFDGRRCPQPLEVEDGVWTVKHVVNPATSVNRDNT